MYKGGALGFLACYGVAVAVVSAYPLIEDAGYVLVYREDPVPAVYASLSDATRLSKHRHHEHHHHHYHHHHHHHQHHRPPHGEYPPIGGYPPTGEYPISVHPVGGGVPAGAVAASAAGAGAPQPPIVVEEGVVDAPVLGVPAVLVDVPYSLVADISA